MCGASCAVHRVCGLLARPITSVLVVLMLESSMLPCGSSRRWVVLRLCQFYRVLDTWDRSGGGVRRAPPRAAPVARRWLWETDDAVRAALDHLVEELYDRREDVQSMLQRLDRNGTGTISRQVERWGWVGAVGWEHCGGSAGGEWASRGVWRWLVVQEMQRGLVGLGIRLTPSELSSVMR